MNKLNSVIAASKVSSDTIFDYSHATHEPANVKNSLSSDIIGSQTKNTVGWLVKDDLKKKLEKLEKP